MGNNSLGEVIRTLRKKAGLSQEKLSEGICSPVSLSRIENGTQMPSSFILEALLNKLGTSTYQICDIYYKNEKQLAFEEEAEKVTKLIFEERITEAKNQLVLLEENAKANNLNMQYYMLLDASIKLHENENAHEIISILNKALALTKPLFNFNDFRNTLLSIQEANILNIIVVAYYRLGETLKAIRLGEELMFALKKHKSGLNEYQIIQINLALNLAQCLEKEHRYKEAFEYAETAEELSIHSHEQSLLPEIEFVKAKAIHLLGNDEECIAICKAIVPYMELIRKTAFAKRVRDYIKNEFEIEI